MVLLGVEAALAYLDPGTGSFIFQVVIGTVLGAMLTLKIYWRRLVGFIARRRPGQTGKGPHEP